MSLEGTMKTEDAVCCPIEFRNYVNLCTNFCLQFADELLNEVNLQTRQCSQSDISTACHPTHQETHSNDVHDRISSVKHGSHHTPPSSYPPLLHTKPSP
jgi:hypothetical protein